MRTYTARMVVQDRAQSCMIWKQLDFRIKQLPSVRWTRTGGHDHSFTSHENDQQANENEVCGNVSHAGTRGSMEANDTHFGAAHYSTLDDWLLTRCRLMLTTFSSK